MLAPKILTSQRNESMKNIKRVTVSVFDTAKRYPMFVKAQSRAEGPLINARYLVEIVNWATAHTTRMQLRTLVESFRKLRDNQKPRIHGEAVRTGPTPLLPRWLYAYGKRGFLDLRESPS